MRIIDSLMGTGKTTFAVQHMNRKPEQRYLYVSPFLDESERIIAACPALDFQQPSEFISKTASFQMLLEEGKNIVTTHELLSRQELTPKMQRSIADNGYTQILDEVIETIQPIADISRAEVDMLFDKNMIEIGENGIVKWTGGDQQVKRFKDIRAQARNRALIWYADTLFLWLFPVHMLEAFTECMVLTFRFASSHMRYELDRNQIGYTMHHIRDGELHDGLQDLRMEKERLATLIDLYDGNLNSIGEKKNVLSVSWYRNGARTGMVKTPLLNMGNFLRHKCGASADNAMWTCFDEFRKKIGVNGYASSFCPCNARATNKHRHRDCLAYGINVYDNPYIVRWFHDYGIAVDQDGLALSHTTHQ